MGISQARSHRHEDPSTSAKHETTTRRMSRSMSPPPPTVESPSWTWDVPLEVPAPEGVKTHHGRAFGGWV